MKFVKLLGAFLGTGSIGSAIIADRVTSLHLVDVVDESGILEIERKDLEWLRDTLLESVAQHNSKKPVVSGEGEEQVEPKPEQEIKEDVSTLDEGKVTQSSDDQDTTEEPLVGDVSGESKEGLNVSGDVSNETPKSEISDIGSDVESIETGESEDLGQGTDSSISEQESELLDDVDNSELSVSDDKKALGDDQEEKSITTESEQGQIVIDDSSEGEDRGEDAKSSEDQNATKVSEIQDISVPVSEPEETKSSTDVNDSLDVDGQTLDNKVSDKETQETGSSEIDGSQQEKVDETNLTHPNKESEDLQSQGSSEDEISVPVEPEASLDTDSSKEEKVPSSEKSKDLQTTPIITKDTSNSVSSVDTKQVQKGSIDKSVGTQETVSVSSDDTRSMVDSKITKDKEEESKPVKSVGTSNEKDSSVPDWVFELIKRLDPEITEKDRELFKNLDLLTLEEKYDLIDDINALLEKSDIRGRIIRVG